MLSLQNYLIQLFSTYESFAFLLSIFLNIILSIIGFLPSVFLTAANIAVFGFEQGLILSFFGEACGAIVSFLLYRKGLRKLGAAKLMQHGTLKKLFHAQGYEAFLLILALRLLPFMPSAAVTVIAALGKTSLLIFVMASTLGKIPAIVIEAYSVHQMMNWTTQGRFLITSIAVFLLWIGWKKIKAN
ncbi:VTT domain-containing protein [Cytobacillus spongiae]|jgi:uncharacterized membrane protein YdjX (TVP38/TMEM64 family)|uniref:TVP38/TMEM64 family protein n=1 Tax=Cytobacillus spongiae TaxID=2901381 RepID=UPI001F2E78A6|nr:VTT domain-containing protein [Cytobacillus spongiae]UII54224.1 VTT domain-containing protein [Cytobacillus spongiae]